MSKRGPKSKAGTLDFWNSKEGKRQIARQLKAEDVSASVQRKAFQARRALGAEGHIRTACPRTACNNCPKVYA